MNILKQTVKQNLRFNSVLLVFAMSACESSGAAKRVPYYGTPELSDFGSRNYLVNSIEIQPEVTDAAEVRRLSESVNDQELCSQTLTDEQLYNPYRHLGLRPNGWTLEKNIDEVDYQFNPTRISQIKVDYWSKTNASGAPAITRRTSTCYAPSAWRTRSPRIELGVHPFVKKYSDCLRAGFPDPNNIDNCQDGMEIIGGLTHRIKGNVVNPHRFRVSWWLKAPANFEEETAKIKDNLKIPSRIPLQIDSLHSQLAENDAYRVRALAFSEEGATDLPAYWLIADDQGQNREFLPLRGVELANNITDAREKILAINRATTVANFSGHYAWDKNMRAQRRSSQLPVSRFFDDHVFTLFKKLRTGTSLNVQVIFRAQDADDVFLEEFLLDSQGNLTLKKVKQLNAYGMSTLGLPDNTRELDANGLEIYHD